MGSNVLTSTVTDVPSSSILLSEGLKTWWSGNNLELERPVRMREGGGTHILSYRLLILAPQIKIKH